MTDCPQQSSRCKENAGEPVGDDTQPVAQPNIPVSEPPQKNIPSGPAQTTPEEDEVDPFCLPDNPVVVTFDKVQEATELIKDGVIKTPCKKSHFFPMTGMEIYLKCEFQQFTGNFKERGARFALSRLDDEQKKCGAITSSLGNHAQAMCHHGSSLGIPMTVVMPVIASIMKVANCRRLGGNVVLHGNNMVEAKRFAQKTAREQGLVFINGYDHPDIIAGQGSCGVEIIEQVPDVDAIIVPTGGGGLLAGIAVAAKQLKPDVKIYGVETELCASFGNSMAKGEPTLTEIGPTLADGLAVPMIGCNSFATTQPLIERMLAVTEESLSLAILRLIEWEKFVVEGAGATGLAAVLSDLVPELKGKTVVLVLSGGNIDSSILGRCIDRGLATDGRLLRVITRLIDRPGGLAEFCGLCASLGVSIKHIMQQRAWIKKDVFSVEVTAIIETQDKNHSVEIKRGLSEKYKEVKFVDFVE